MYNDLKKTTIEITNFRFENDEFSKRKEKKRKGGGGGGDETRTGGKIS